VIDVIEDYRPLIGGDPPGESPAHRDPYALAYFLLQPGRGRSEQVPGRVVQQQGRGRVGVEDGPGALEQLGKQVMIIKAGKGSVGDRMDVPQPGLQPSGSD
jgi:hypothetical protein